LEFSIETWRCGGSNVWELKIYKWAKSNFL
jgi:hypothetical protein